MSVLFLRRPGVLQPSGPADVDWGNPLTRKLCFAWSAGAAVEAKSKLLRTTNNTQAAVSKVGKFAACATGQTNLEWNRQFCTTSDGAGGGDFAFFVLANPRATGGGAVEHALSQKNDAASPYAQATILFNSDESAAYTSGQVAFFTYSGSATGVTVHGLQDGNWHLWGGVRRGSVVELWRDGVLVASASGTVRNILQAATRYTAIGSRGNGTTEGYRDGAALGLMFNRAPSRAEIASLAANPNQIFRTAQQLWIPALGGATTITATIGTAVAYGFTGTVNANRTIAGALGTATASGFQGVVNANRTISGALGTAVASGLAGNVNANRKIAGALGTATASGFQGTVTNGNTTTITGSLGTAVATGFTGGVAWNRYIAGLLGVATASGFTGGVANGASSGGDGGTSKRKYYIRRRKQILIFDSVAQVDAYIEAEEEAAEAIAKAKSRGAKKRAIARVFKAQPETVEITPLAELIESYKLPYNVGELIASENYQQIVDIQRLIQRIRDDEDEELLLLLA